MDDINTTILNYMDDVVAKFLYYDRKEDECLPVGRIEEAIASKEITIEDIVNKFDSALRAGVSSS